MAMNTTPHYLDSTTGKLVQAVSTGGAVNVADSKDAPGTWTYRSYGGPAGAGAEVTNTRAGLSSLADVVAVKFALNDYTTTEVAAITIVINADDDTDAQAKLDAFSGIRLRVGDSAEIYASSSNPITRIDWQTDVVEGAGDTSLFEVHTKVLS